MHIYINEGYCYLAAADLSESTCSRNSRMTQSQNVLKVFFIMTKPLSVFLAISEGSNSGNTSSNLNLQALYKLD
jgi:hypothetical protein